MKLEMNKKEFIVARVSQESEEGFAYMDPYNGNLSFFNTIDNATKLSSVDEARELVIGKDTVYIHTNIRPYVDKNEIDKEKKSEIYIYDEVQMSKDEYLEMFKDNVDEVTSLSNDRLTDIESAITILMGGI